jgi:putative endopeptidase
MRRSLPVISSLSAVAMLVACGGSHPVRHDPGDGDGVTSDAGTAAASTTMTLAETGLMPDWMDRSADPCVDFDEFACGGFIASAVIPPDRNSWGAIVGVAQDIQEYLHTVLEQAAADPGDDPTRKVIGDYYAACMDEAAVDAAGIKPLAATLDAIATVKNAASAARVITELHQGGVFPLFSVWPSQDFADATLVITGIDQSGIGLPDRDYYLEDAGNMKTVREVYRGHVARMFGLAGASGKAATAAAADVMRIETALARKQQDKVTRRDPHAIYHRVDRAGLVKLAPSFPWASYFTALGISDDKVTVSDPAYLGFAIALLGKEKPAALRNYLTWTVLRSHANLLGKAFRAERLTLAKATSGVTAEPPRWRQCVDRVDADLGQLLAQPYVAARFGGDARQQARDLVAAVEGAMHDELAELPWMDDATRKAAEGKLAAIAALVGYPDSWLHYDVAISRSDFAGDALAASRFEMRRQLAKIGKPVDRLDWQMTPPTVNAYYDPTLNQIVLPAGILQPPFFGARFHPAVNFGSTGGGTIGHELTHGFDDEGSQFDAKGNLRQWWSDATRKQFEQATQCVVDQYAGYEAVPGVKLNGKLTAGENIADIGGVKIAFRAYHAWRAAQDKAPPAMVDGLSDDQIFYLAYAQSWCAKVRPEQAETRAHSDPHSPPRWRVNGVVADQPGFRAAFGCKVGTPMAPARACSVW